jgi:uncharacterized membrane protein YhaH (DUF805 family)
MVKLFTMKGRITRSQYIFTSLVLFVISFVIAFGAGFVAGLSGLSEEATSAIGWILGVGFAVIQSFLVVRRLHDLGKPGWHYWLFYVPLYNIYLGLVILFTPGTQGVNAYGSDPAAS